MKKCNNKGSTLIVVIVTIGFIGILASIILLATANNIFLKRVDLQAKTNFYTAETVVDEIEMGLQADMAEVMVNAYYDVLSSFDGTVDTATKLHDFKGKVLNGNAGNYTGFVKMMQDAGEEEIKKIIDKDILIDYIDDDLKSYTTITGVSFGTSEAVTFTYDETTYNTYTVKGLIVRFKKDDYYTEISTDIKIKIPEPDFSIADTAATLAAFKEYSIIAGKKIEASSNNKVEIDGNVWAGDDGILVQNPKTQLKIKCTNLFSEGNITSYQCNGNEGVNNIDISLIDGSTADAPYIVAGGLEVKKNGAVSSNTNTNINIDGTCIVRNDMTLDSERSNVKITGAYLGFGESEEYNPYTSSSIIINGKNSSLIMKLQNLALAGRAYIATSELGALDYNLNSLTTANSLGINGTATVDEAVAGYDILTGESITIRGNQAAYLVPFKNTPFVGNPVTKTEYNNYLDKYIEEQEKLGVIVTMDQAKLDLSKSIRDSLLADTTLNTYLDNDRPFIAMFYKPKDVNSSDGVVYYYLNFASKAKATEYYYYSVAISEETRNKFAKLVPVKEVKIESQSYDMMGNYILNADSNTQTIVSGRLADETPSSFVGTSAEIFKYMRAYFTPQKALDAAAGSEEKSALENLLKMDDIKAEDNLEGQDRADYVIKKTLNNYTAIVVNNEYTSPYHVPANFQGIVVATGDVIIDSGDVTGLVIADGDIKIIGNYSLEADSGVVSTILKTGYAYTAKSGKKLNDFFVSEELNSVFSTGAKDSMSVVSLEDMFTFENWKKQ